MRWQAPPLRAPRGPAPTYGCDTLRSWPARPPSTPTAWRTFVDATKSQVLEASLDDLALANCYAFGTPTRFGLPAAQLKQLLDHSGALWQSGAFLGKPATSFTSPMNAHGGQESTILGLNNVFYHWGCLILGPGYRDPLLFATGGNPYGTSATSSDGPPSDAVL